jgi:hypothetical protein
MRQDSRPCQPFKTDEPVFQNREGLRTQAPLLRAVSRQDVEHPVVAFMAGDFEQRSDGPSHRHFDSPGPDEHRGVLNRGLVRQRVRIGDREAFDDAKALIAQPVEVPDAETALMIELQVRRFDDERGPVPSSA